MRSTDNLYAHLSDEDIDLLLASDTNSPTRRRGLERERAAREAPNVTQNLEAANSEFAVEPTVLYRTQPGPRDFGSGKATPGRDLTTPEEVAAYTRRTPISEATQEQMDAAQLPAAGGAYLPSQEDVDMYNRGLVYMYDPNTFTSGYTMAYPRAPEPHVGVPGRVGLRPDLERPVVDFRTGQPIKGTHKYEKTVVETPFGQQEAYRPSAAYRQQLDARQQARIRETLVRKSGLDAETAAGMDLEQLRAAGRDRREAELEARKAAVIRRAQERQNPMAQLDDEWRQYVLASRLLGGPAGASPTDVSRAHNEQLTALGLRVAQGQGFQQPTEAQVRGANTAADAKDAELAQAVSANADEIVREYADNQGWTNLLSRLNPFTSGVDFHDPTVFTSEERAKSIARLRAKYPHLSLEQAAQFVDAAAADTTPQYE